MKRPALLALAALAACGKKSTDAPWLTMPDLARHSALYFPIGPSDVHGAPPGRPVACDACHADRSSGATPPPPAASFKTFTCTGCHVEVRPGVFHDDIAALAAVAGHASGPVFDPTKPLAYDPACRSCHPTGMAVAHALLFPLPHQDAAGTIVAACGDCHVSGTDRTVLGCAACHPHDQPATATAHALVPDFDASPSTAASALCARCHGDSTVPILVAAHAAFPIGGSSPHAGPTGGACLACHPAFRTAPKAFAGDFTQPSCTGCHVMTSAGYHDDPTGLSSYHVSKGVTGFQFTTAACLSCHPDGTGAPSYHADLFPIDAGSKHAGIACASCHGPDRADLTQLQCASCHADPSKSPAFPTLHAPVGNVAILVELTPPPASCTPTALPPLQSPDCLKCHARSAPVLVSAHPLGDTAFGQDPHRTAGCLTCHVQSKQVTASVTPPTPPPAGYPTIDFLTFVTTVTSVPIAPTQAAKGCATCHSYGCGGSPGQ